MSNPLVSISCITYNHAPYIRQCLDGFLMQECDFEYEILIHDDASTDGTSDIIREYQKKYPEIIKPIIQTENQWSQGVRGMNAKFNFSRATGKYIALCEGDDYWTDPLKLQKQADIMENNPKAVLSFHLMEKLLPNGKIEKTSSSNFHKEITYRNDLLNYNYIATLTTMFRQSAYNPKTNTKLGKLTMGDYSLYLSLLKSPKDEIIFIPEVMAVYRAGRPESLSNALPIINFYLDYIKIYKILPKIYNNLTLEEKNTIHSSLAKIYMKATNYYIKEKKIFKGIILPFKSFLQIIQLSSTLKKEKQYYSYHNFYKDLKKNFSLIIKGYS